MKKKLFLTLFLLLFIPQSAFGLAIIDTAGVPTGLASSPYTFEFELDGNWNVLCDTFQTQVQYRDPQNPTVSNNVYAWPVETNGGVDFASSLTIPTGMQVYAVAALCYAEGVTPNNLPPPSANNLQRIIVAGCGYGLTTCSGVAIADRPTVATIFMGSQASTSASVVRAVGTDILALVVNVVVTISAMVALFVGVAFVWRKASRHVFQRKF